MLAEYMDAVINSGPQVFYPMQEASGNFLDEIGSQDLTVSGTISYQEAGPAADVFAVEFGADGAGGNTGFDLNQVSDFAIEMWINPGTVTGNLMRLHCPDTTWDFPDSHLRIVYQGVTILGSTDHSFDDDEWKHVIFGREGSESKWFIDGALDTAYGATTGDDHGAGFTVGHASAAMPGFYTMVAVYDYLPSDFDIASHYAAMTSSGASPHGGGFRFAF